MLVIQMLAVTWARSGLEWQGQLHKVGHTGMGVSVTQDVE